MLEANLEVVIMEMLRLGRCESFEDNEEFWIKDTFIAAIKRT